MKKKLLIIFALGLILFSACKKTETDLEWEKSIMGYKWEPKDKNNNRIYYMPIFEFGEDSRGKSYLNLNSTDIDEFGWEIRRKQMRLYYDRGPTEYSIGQDKYNSKAIFQVNSIVDSILSMTHLTNTGYEVDYYFYKIK